MKLNIDNNELMGYLLNVEDGTMSAQEAIDSLVCLENKEVL